MSGEGGLQLTKRGPWATFNLADEVFAVSAEDIQEVLLEQPLTPVPLAPKYVVGLLNLRGQVMAAIDLRTRLHFAPRADGAQSSLLVLKLNGTLVSVVVDSIGDVLELDNAGWEGPPQTLAPHFRAFVFGIYPNAEKMVLGLNVDHLEGDDDVAAQESKK